MIPTASIKLKLTPEQSARLVALRTAYTGAGNRLVRRVCQHRLWNRVELDRRSYRMLRKTTPLGSQMCCNLIFSLSKAYQAEKKLGHIRQVQPIATLPCVVVFNPTTAKARNKSCGRSPAKRCGPLPFAIGAGWAFTPWVTVGIGHLKKIEKS